MNGSETLFRLVELVIAAIVGVGGYLVSQRVSKSTIKKQNNEGADIITGAAIELVKPLRDEITELRAELRTQQKEIKRLKNFEDGVYILIDQMKRLNIKPDWTPPEDKNEQTRYSEPSP